MKSKTSWKSFNIRMPEELIPLYNFLQSEMNFVLTNRKQELMNINLNQHLGYVRTDIRDVMKDRIDSWEINNKAWYGLMVCENIARELRSKQERIEIFRILEKHNFTLSTSLREELSNQGLYPTNSHLKNLIASKECPTLPNTATFNMDFTVSNKSNFTMSETGLCRFKIGKKEWLDYQIFIPSSVNHQLTGYIAKPRFFKRKSDGKYIGLCSYEYLPLENTGQSILGVDLGQIKLYSVVAIDEHGNHSEEFIHSQQLQRQKEKIDRLTTELEILYKKKVAYAQLGINNTKPALIEDEYFKVKNKITRIKLDQARLIANEVVDLARRLNCKEIHLENLSWLGSQGGKWQFSNIQNRIEEQAKEFSIKVVKVNPCNTSKAHPITNEIGIVTNRTVKFKKQFRI